MNSSVVLAVLTGLIALAILSGCATGSENQTLQERATEASKHIDGSESGWRKTYRYLTPEFRSQCTEDEFTEHIMSLSALFMGYGAKYKAEVLTVTETGNVGTVTSRIVNGAQDADSTEWIKVDGTWWDASWDKDSGSLLPDC